MLHVTKLEQKSALQGTRYYVQDRNQPGDQAIAPKNFQKRVYLLGTTSYNHFAPAPENSTTTSYDHFVSPKKYQLVAALIMSLQKPKAMYATSKRQHTAAGGNIQITWGGIDE